MVGSYSNFELVVKNTVSQLTIDTSTTASCLLGNLFFGYGHTTLKGVYIGGEIGTCFPKKKATIHRYGVVYTGDVYTNRMSVRDIITGDMQFGYRTSERVLVAIRAGAVFSQISLSQDVTPSIANSAFSDSAYRFGARVGTRLNYSLSQRLSLGVDYVYSHYGNTEFMWDTFSIEFTKKVKSNYAALSTVVSF